MAKDIEVRESDSPVTAFFSAWARSNEHMEETDTERETWPCGWLVERPSGNPEPDSIEDTYVIVECGATAYEIEDGWECEAGHRHYTYGSQRWAEQDLEDWGISWNTSGRVVGWH